MNYSVSNWKKRIIQWICFELLDRIHDCGSDGWRDGNK